MYIVDSLIFCIIVYQCLDMLLWSTEVLTEELPLNMFSAPFSVVNCVVICTMLTWMDERMDGWIILLFVCTGLHST